MKNFIKKEINGKLAISIVMAAFLIAASAIILSSQGLELDLPISFPGLPHILPTPPLVSPGISPISSPLPSPTPVSIPISPAELKKTVKKFTSETDFKDYLQKAAAIAEAEYFGGGLTRDMAIMMEAAPVPAPTISGLGAEEKAAPAALPERVSETTVQVLGIDEPDIIKTNGKEIYFAPSPVWVYREPGPIRPLIEEIGEKLSIYPPYPGEQKAKTKVIKAFPPADLAVLTDIDKAGDLLLDKDILTIFSQRETYDSGLKVYGFNISDPKKPEKKWEMELEENNSIVGSRLYKNKIYLVVQTRINEVHPCPIKLLSIEGKPLTIECGEIYHPVLPIPTDVTFIALVLNPASGEVEKKISFVGSAGSSIVYMSEQGIYVTYSYREDVVKFTINFIKEKARDLFPDWLIEKIEKLEGYDISQQAKLVEFQANLNKYYNSLDDDERLRVENELSNRMSDYYKERKRELEKTGLVKIGLEKFEIEASGNVPGYPLNQFSLDEYQGNLRIAITVGERWWGGPIPGMGGGESANDVYVLDGTLKILGSVKDLGLTERIYSVRFIEDKGYVVTFRQVDPFYVLDLSNPRNPELKGQLKIPGYSSYLHPLTKDKILGMGKEDWKVKISLFDVSSPAEPKELDKYILDESWSEVLSTHHAFLLDKKHDIFFLPGSEGGYVFSFKDDKLKLVKAISQTSVKRALYIDDYLYIVSDREINVFNEIDWIKVNELEL